MADVREGLTNQQPDLSIVSVSYNTREVFRDCLAAVEAHHDGVTLEHWIVDNGSADGSVAMIEREFPQAMVIVNERNAGPGRARNQAIQRCRGRYVLNLDTDVIVHAGTLAEMVHFMDQNPDVAVAGCKLLNEDGSYQSSAFQLPRPLPTLMAKIRARLTKQREDLSSVTTPISIGWLKGAICIYNRRAFDEVGVFDPQFFIYSEDIDLHMRFRLAGWRNAYVPGVTATHLGKRSVQQNFAESLYGRECSVLLLTQKHGPAWWHWYTRASAMLRGFYFWALCSDAKLRRVTFGADPTVVRGVYGDLFRTSLPFRKLAVHP